MCFQTWLSRKIITCQLNRENFLFNFIYEEVNYSLLSQVLPLNVNYIELDFRRWTSRTMRKDLNFWGEFTLWQLCFSALRMRISATLPSRRLLHAAFTFQYSQFFSFSFFPFLVTDFYYFHSYEYFFYVLFIYFGVLFLYFIPKKVSFITNLFMINIFFYIRNFFLFH